MKKVDLLRKLGSRKFWACISAVVIALIAFTSAEPETTERVVALVSAICGDPIKLDQIPERIYIFSGIFYAAFFSLYSIGLKYPNFSFILSLL